MYKNNFYQNRAFVR